MLKLEDGTDIPIDDAFEIFRSLSFDDAVDGKYFVLEIQEYTYVFYKERSSVKKCLFIVVFCFLLYSD